MTVRRPLVIASGMILELPAGDSLPTAGVTSVAGKTGDVTLAESDIAGLQGDLASKVPVGRAINTGAGLTGGGDLSADRTISPTYGTAANTVCQGNDARLSDTRIPTDGTVTNAKVASNAAIALSKLATGYVQGSNNGTPTTLTVWVGTEAQFQALGSKDAATIYFRT